MVRLIAQPQPPCNRLHALRPMKRAEHADEVVVVSASLTPACSGTCSKVD